MHKTESLRENETHKILWDFENKRITSQQIRSSDNNNKNKRERERERERERTGHTVDFTFLADNKVKIKESEKRDKYLNLSRELRKLWNMRVAVMPIVIGALGTS